MRTTSVFFAVLLAACVASAVGKTYAANPFGNDGNRQRDSMRDQALYRTYPPYYPGRYHHGSIYRHASTPAEGFARGAAALLRARGEYLLLASHARVTAAEARRREIENRQQWIESSFQMREANRQLRAAERRPRPSRETLAAYARAGRPDRLSPGELDPATGQVSWPMLLLADAFAPYRAQIEALFADRAVDGELTVAGSLRIAETTKTMLAELKGRIAQLPASEYMAARQFLESLAYEVRCLPGQLGG
jgi:hypothetical protein